MEKVRPWCGQPSDRGQLKNRTEKNIIIIIILSILYYANRQQDTVESKKKHTKYHKK